MQVLLTFYSNIMSYYSLYSVSLCPFRPQAVLDKASFHLNDINPFCFRHPFTLITYYGDIDSIGGASHLHIVFGGKEIRFDWKRFLFSLLFIGVLFTALYFISAGIAYEFHTTYRLDIAIIWMYAWPLPLGAYFARHRIKTWLKPGRSRVEVGSLAIAVLCGGSIVFIPGSKLFMLLISANLVPVVAIFFWYHLLYAFYKEPIPQPEG